MRHQHAFHEQVATPLRPPVADELRWFFGRGATMLNASTLGSSAPPPAFAGLRFLGLYRTWLEPGDVVVDATISPVLADAVTLRTGRSECHVLPHAYLHLSSLVGTA